MSEQLHIEGLEPTPEETTAQLQQKLGECGVRLAALRQEYEDNMLVVFIDNQTKRRP